MSRHNRASITAPHRSRSGGPVWTTQRKLPPLVLMKSLPPPPPPPRKTPSIIDAIAPLGEYDAQLRRTHSYQCSHVACLCARICCMAMSTRFHIVSVVRSRVHRNTAQRGAANTFSLVSRRIFSLHRSPPSEVLGTYYM